VNCVSAASFDSPLPILSLNLAILLIVQSNVSACAYYEWRLVFGARKLGF
jgi:hypothetical protein